MKLRHRLNIGHVVESAKSFQLAKRQPNLYRVGQAAKPRLDQPIDLAKPRHEAILLLGDFSDPRPRGLGDFALGQAALAKPHRNLRSRLAVKHRIDQARFCCQFNPKRLAKRSQANAK